MARPRGREATQPRGRHVQAGNIGDVMKLIGEFTPLFNRVLSLYFFRVEYVPTRFFIAGDVATRRALDLGGNHRSRGPESTRSSINTRAFRF